MGKIIIQIITIAALAVFSSNNVAANSVSTDADICPQICPALYAPLCTTNGKVFKEFSNSCEMRQSNCRLERAAIIPYTQIDMDWCTSEFTPNIAEIYNVMDIKSECLKPCPMIYAPVCISNGVLRGEISNSCQMEMINCIVGNNARLFKILQPESC